MQIVQRARAAHQYESLLQSDRSGVPRQRTGNRVTRHPSGVTSGEGGESPSWFSDWWPFSGRRTPAEPPAEERGAGGPSPFGPRVASPNLRSGAQPADLAAAVGGRLQESIRATSGQDEKWMPDDKCTSCYNCGAQFGVVRRKHHCRLCGQIFCHKCSSHWLAGLYIGRPRETLSRLCDDCAANCKGLPVSSGRNGRPQSSQAAGQASPEPVSQRSSGSTGNAAGMVGSPLQGQADPQQARQSATDIDGDDDDTSSSSSVGPNDEDADSAHPSSAERNDEEASPAATRADSSASLPRNDVDASTSWYNMFVQGPVDGQFGLGNAEMQVIETLLKEEHESECATSASTQTHLTAWRRMTDVAFRHFVQCVQMKCQEVRGGLEDPSHVLTICELAQHVVDHLVARLEPGDQMDILQYVKVKRIPGGRISDSHCVDGVVFTCDIAHRKMRSSIGDCNIALLREPISFDHETKLTSLDKLRKEEADFIGLKVEKIKDLLTPKPDLLLCQGGVSQIAQEQLRKLNISLVLGVKSHILEAVARCNGTRILPSVDMISRCVAGGKASFVGRCRNFKVLRTGEIWEAGSKPLVVIEGACSDRFLSVCLRGGEKLPPQEALDLLTRAKRVLRWAIRLARHLQLESELLFEMWCEPMPRPAPSLCSGTEDAAEGSAEGEELDHLDFTCYYISRNEGWSCTPPEVLRIPLYATPQAGPDAAAGAAAARRDGEGSLAGWAGGLEVGPTEGMRDCTVFEWLNRCFQPETGRLPARPLAVQELAAGTGSMLSDEGGRVNMDIAVGSQALDPPIFDPDAWPGAAGGSAVGLAGATRAALGGTARWLEPPVPTKGRVLCFGRARGLIVVQFGGDDTELNEVLRRRCDSCWEHQSVKKTTRWELLNDGESEEAVDCASAGQSGNGSGQIVTWWYCKVCKKRLTPQSALSPSAGRHSLAKFLELLLHGDATISSAGTKTKECSHPAFKSHVLIIRNTHSPVFMALTSEPVQLWHLTHPHQPFWGPQNLIVDTVGPAKATSELGRNAKAELDGLMKQLRELVAQINALVYTMFIVMFTMPVQAEVGCDLDQPGLKSSPASSDTDLARTGSRSVSFAVPSAAPRSGLDEWVESRTGSRSVSFAMTSAAPTRSNSMVVAADGTVEESGGKKAARIEPGEKRKEGAEGGKEEAEIKKVVAWLTENRRALKQLTGLKMALSQRLKAADDKLCQVGDDGVPGAKDPILVNFVQRDLLDALNTKAEMPERDASLRGARGELLALQKQCSRVVDERSKGILPSALTPFFRNATDTLRRLWPSEVDQSSGSGVDHKRTASTPLIFKIHSQHLLNEPSTWTCSTSEAGQRRGAARPRDKSDDSSVRRRRALQVRNSTAYDRSDLESRRRNALERLPKQHKEVLEALECATQEGQGRLASISRSTNGLFLPYEEEDVGSLIAHALLSHQAHQQMAAQWAAIGGGTRRCCPLADPQGSGSECSCFFSMPACLRGQSVDCPTAEASQESFTPAQSSTAEARGRTGAGLAELQWKRLPRDRGGSGSTVESNEWEERWEKSGVRDALKSPITKQPVKVEWEEKGERYTVDIHYAPQYHIIRHWLCGDDLNFARSLHRCNKITPSGGKTKTAFYVSHDRRFLLKAVNRAEFGMLETEKNVEALVWYADQVLFDKLPSVLAQVLGLFTVRKKGRARKYFIVQRNLRFGLEHRPHSVFDLKGVGQSRRQKGSGDEEAQAQPPEQSNEAGEDDGVAEGTADDEDGPRPAAAAASSAEDAGTQREATKLVLWDQNFREWTRGKPMCLVSHDLKYLEAAVWNDTLLLWNLKLVDYSLLLAAGSPEEEKKKDQSSEEPGTLSLGIIDYLRPYDNSKAFESNVKRLWKDPTILSPIDYRNRFLAAMRKFFVAEVPGPG